MGFASLGSGSKGNGTVVSLHGGERPVTVLIDCGFSLRQSEARLARLGISGGDLDAILVSHEHAESHRRGARPGSQVRDSGLCLLWHRTRIRRRLPLL